MGTRQFFGSIGVSPTALDFIGQWELALWPAEQGSRPLGSTMAAERIPGGDPNGSLGAIDPRGAVVFRGRVPAAEEAQDMNDVTCHAQPQRGRLCLWIVVPLLLLAGVPLPAWGGEAGAAQLQKWYQELRELAPLSPFGVPLSIQSEEPNDRVTAEVHGIIEYPFDTVKAALSTPAALCEFIPLNATIKACTYQSQASDALLTLYFGRKQYQEPQEASSQPYNYAVQAAEPGTLSVVLSAIRGLFGTTAHRFQLDAAGVEGRTVVALRSSYVQSAASKLATAIYLATAGRDKVGFSHEDAGPGDRPGYVKGLRGMVERNIMRYYLALEAFLDTETLPAPHRWEARVSAAYELMERYPLQLHDLEKAEYLDAKRREHENQLRLQQKLTGPAQSLGPVATAPPECLTAKFDL